MEERVEELRDILLDFECSTDAEEIYGHPVEYFQDAIVEEILKVYREQDEFTPEQHEVIDVAISEGELTTEDCRVDFKEWFYALNLGIPEEELWDYDEHYGNGWTHKQNLKEFLEFRKSNQ